MEELRAEFRWQVGYWKSRHADALKRNEQLTEELRQAKGQIRTLQDKLFGRKSEKSAGSDRSNELLDPEERPRRWEEAQRTARPIGTRSA